jgi:hypothetical protein
VDYLTFGAEFLTFGAEFLTFGAEFLTFGAEFLTFHFSQVIEDKTVWRYCNLGTL